MAEGIYTPDCNSADPNGSGDRETTFQLISGVAIKGGYAGFSEPDPNERDPNLYETVLSGDLDGNDVDVNAPADLLDEPSRAENSYHVVTGSGTDETGVLDGFTITGGNANESYVLHPKDYGGGMFNHGSSSSPTLLNCRLVLNSATNRGGGMYNSGSPTLTNCTFSENSTNHNGGAMFNWNSSSILTNCTFSDNSAESWGGAIFNRSGSNLTLINCIFRGNSAAGDGGALAVWGGCSPSLMNCVFIQNSTGGNGSGCGGAMFNYDGSSPELSNCTFGRNQAVCGGGIYSWGSSLMVANSLFWGNNDNGGVDESAQIHTDSGTVVVNYCCIQGWTGALGGIGNIGDNPLFVDANDYRLTEGSPCIDSGDNNSVPADTADLDGDGNTTEPIPWDLEGNPRVFDGNNDGNAVVDMGAYEYVPPVEVGMKFTPQALNPGSQGKWVKAHFVLPEGYAVEDVDANRPAKITELFEPDIDSNHVSVFINDDNLVEVEAAFERGVFCEADIGDEAIEVTAVGSFTSGQQFYGTDTIKVTTSYFKHLGVLASYWLVQECDKPDWCEGTDLDQDSGVDFVDLALYDGCCIEVVP